MTKVERDITLSVSFTAESDKRGYVRYIRFNSEHVVVVDPCIIYKEKGHMLITPVLPSEGGRVFCLPSALRGVVKEGEFFQIAYNIGLRTVVDTFNENTPKRKNKEPAKKEKVIQDDLVWLHAYMTRKMLLLRVYIQDVAEELFDWERDKIYLESLSPQKITGFRKLVEKSAKMYSTSDTDACPYCFFTPSCHDCHFRTHKSHCSGFNKEGWYARILRILNGYDYSMDGLMKHIGKPLETWVRKNTKYDE